MNDLLDTPPVAVDLIKAFESFVPTWYLDAVGVWTIGYGTSVHMPGVSRQTIREPLSEEEATRWLHRGLIRYYEPPVEEYVSRPINPYQFGALVSFVYNVGPGNFRRSTLLKRVNAGRFDEAGGEFLKWVYAGGQVLRGLKRRRMAERELFLRSYRDDSTRRVVDRLIAEARPMRVRGVTPFPIGLPKMVLRKAYR